MLYLDEPIRVDGLNLFRDYGDRELFHYLPNSPSVAIEGGEPMFQLLVWRGEDAEGGAEGGGFLTMTADLAADEDQLESARREIQRRFGVSARLVPVQVESGTVKVSILDGASGQADAGAFVEKVLASGTPSLYGDQRAVFSAELDQRGATLVREALEVEGATPVVLVYELTYRGLMPAYECTIEIEFDQSYRYLKDRTTFSSLWFEMDVDRELEQLRKDGAIRIEEVVFETDDPAAREQRMQTLRTLAKDLAQWSFFKPGLTPGSVLAQGVRDLHARGGLSAGIDPSADRAIRTMMTGEGTPEGTPPARPAVADSEAGGERLSGARAAAAEEGGADSESDAAEDGAPESDAAGAGGTSAAVAAWNAAGRPQATFQLREIRQEERQRISYNLRQVSALTRSIAPQGQLRLLDGMASARGRILDVDLDDDFFKRIEGTVSNRADLARFGIASMNVTLHYGEAEEGDGPHADESFDFDAAGQEATFGFFRDAAGSLELRYRVTVNYQPDAAIGNDASSSTTDWVTTLDRHIEIDPRVAGDVAVLDLQMGTVDWELVRQVQARVVYEDPGGGDMDGATTVLLDRDSPAETVRVRPRSEDDPIRVDATFHYTDGGTETVGLGRAGSGPVVINQPPDSIRTVDVTLLDPLDRYRRVVVEFSRDDGDTTGSVELVGHHSRGTWSYRPEEDEEEASYRWRPTYFLDGPVREETWAEESRLRLQVGDLVGGLLRVSAVLLGPLEPAGMRAARIGFRYDGTYDWADPDFEITVVAGREPETVEWTVPMKDPRATTWQVEVEWFGADGSRTTVEPVEVDSETVLLDPATPEVVL